MSLELPWLDVLSLSLSLLLFFIGLLCLLSQRNEVTAAKASGISLYRLALPGVAVALGIVAFSFILQLHVLPASNRVVSQLEDRIMGREGSKEWESYPSPTRMMQNPFNEKGELAPIGSPPS